MSTNTTPPLVSVIIIFLNEERFLEEAIGSVLAQSYQNWELLLVDDGSTDQSTFIALKYTEQSPEKIRYYQHEEHRNKGMSASRNLGLQHARGAYLCFLDADDWWYPNKLKEQVRILQENPEAGLVAGCTQWWYSWTGNPEDQDKDFIQTLHLPLNTVVEPPALVNSFLKDEWATIHDLLVRREVAEAVEGYEDTFRGMYEDQVFHSKLGLRYPAVVSGATWCRYRQHPEACTTQTHQQGQYRAARFAFLRWLKSYLKEERIEDPETWKILQQQLWPYRYPWAHRLKNWGIAAGRQLLPASLRHWLWIQWRYQPRPPLGWVRWGSLRRLKPISPVWPNHRGTPVDRYYIEGFIATHATDIKGHVLELGDAAYTRRFGGARVTKSDVLHARPGNPEATMVADLTNATELPANAFDCIILTQTLLLIYDLHAVIRSLYQMLRPGGVVLVTLPGITPIVREDMETYGQYWSFTQQSARKLFEEAFAPEKINTQTFGNVLSATAFLYGLSWQELKKKELDFQDPDFQLIIGLRVEK